MMRTIIIILPGGILPERKMVRGAPHAAAPGVIKSKSPDAPLAVPGHRKVFTCNAGYPSWLWLSDRRSLRNRSTKRWCEFARRRWLRHQLWSETRKNGHQRGTTARESARSCAEYFLSRAFGRRF